MPTLARSAKPTYLSIPTAPAGNERRHSRNEGIQNTQKPGVQGGGTRQLAYPTLLNSMDSLDLELYEFGIL